MRFFRLAELPPLIFFEIFIAVWGLPYALPKASSFLTVALISFEMAWTLDLFLLSRPEQSDPVRFSTIVLFVLPILGLVTMIVLSSRIFPGLQPSSTHLNGISSVGDAAFAILIILCAGSLFAATWLSAKALVGAEAALSDTANKPAVGTFLAVLCLPFTIWWLSSRIGKVAAAGKRR
jgi:hypothetical protein